MTAFEQPSKAVWLTCYNFAKCCANVTAALALQQKSLSQIGRGRHSATTDAVMAKGSAPAGSHRGTVTMLNNYRSRLLASTLIVGASLAAPAFAQDQAAPADQTAAADAAPAGGEIVVTG